MYTIVILGLTDNQHVVLSMITVPNLVLSMWHSIVSRKFFFAILAIILSCAWNK